MVKQCRFCAFYYNRGRCQQMEQNVAKTLPMQVWVQPGNVCPFWRSAAVLPEVWVDASA